MQTVLVQSASDTRMAATVAEGDTDSETCAIALRAIERRDPGQGWRAVTIIDREPLHWFERFVTL